MICYPPDNIRFSMNPSLFLAGSIEMGVAEKWQSRVATILEPYFDIYNPRRPDWDSSWGPGSPQLVEQIRWELNAINEATHVLFYFDPNTKSPISLLELGLCLGTRKPTIVVCPPEFYRYDNVALTFQNFEVDSDDLFFHELDSAVDFILDKCKG